MNIVRAQRQDAPALTELATLAKGHWGYPAEWMAAWRADLTITREYIAAHPTFTAIESGRIIGMCAVQFDQAGAWLDHLWVHPSKMGMGVGRELFEQAVTTAREGGANRLLIVSDPHAEAFYRRMGATVYGQQRTLLHGTPRVLPLLEKAL